AAGGTREAAGGRRQSRRCREGPERARWSDKNCVACLCLLAFLRSARGRSLRKRVPSPARSRAAPVISTRTKPPKPRLVSRRASVALIGDLGHHLPGCR